MQINPTGQITSDALVQAIISGSQTPVQVAADTQASQVSSASAKTDQVSISSQAQALANSEISEAPGTESIELPSVQAQEGEASSVG